MARPRLPPTPRPPEPDRLEYQSDPLARSLRVLGRKWSLLILREFAFRRASRFSELRRHTPGLTPRVLSRRLREMAAEGLVTRVGAGRSVRYRLTPRGEDAVYILLAFLRYGLKYHPSPADRATAVVRGRERVAPPE